MLFVSSFANEVILYVSPDGNDYENCGEENDPCKSVLFTTNKVPKNYLAKISLIEANYYEDQILLEDAYFVYTSVTTKYCFPSITNSNPNVEYLFTIHNADCNVSRLSVNATWSGNDQPRLFSCTNSSLILEYAIVSVQSSDYKLEYSTYSSLIDLTNTTFYTICTNLMTTLKQSDITQYDESSTCLWSTGYINMVETNATFINSTISNYNFGGINAASSCIQFNGFFFNQQSLFPKYPTLLRTLTGTNTKISGSNVSTSSKAGNVVNLLFNLDSNCVTDDLLHDNMTALYGTAHLERVDCAMVKSEDYQEKLKLDISGSGILPCKMEAYLIYDNFTAHTQKITSIESSEKASVIVDDEKFGHEYKKFVVVLITPGWNGSKQYSNGIFIDLGAEGPYENGTIIDDAQNTTKRDPPQNTTDTSKNVTEESSSPSKARGTSQMTIMIIVSACVLVVGMICSAVVAAIVVAIVFKRRNRRNVANAPRNIKLDAEASSFAINLSDEQKAV